MELTPLQKQLRTGKWQHPSSLLFFRIGDYYEAYKEDAYLVAETLDIALTNRVLAGHQRVAKVSIPCCVANAYFDRLVAEDLSLVVYEYIGENHEGQVYGKGGQGK